MSEHQLYQWKKVGRNLSPEQRKEVSKLSSHISVTADSAGVTYNWGDFKHDPGVVLARYFDVFLYEANWGTQWVEFRFDVGTVDIDRLVEFALGDALVIKAREEGVFVEARFDENWIESSYSYYDKCEDIEGYYLEALESIYREIQQGDYRGLFLLWLKGCELSTKETEAKMVGLPKGMAELEKAHRILADFVEVDEHLIKQAARRSRPLPGKKKIEESLDLHLSKLSVDRKEEYVKRLVSEDAYAVQSALRGELRKIGNHRSPNHLGEAIRYEELADAAKHEAQEEAQRAKKEKERQREKYLDELGKREDEIWDRAQELVSEKNTKSYEEAVLLLRALEDLWVLRGDRGHFLKAVKCIASEFPRLIGFRKRLEKAGWLEPARMNVIMRSQRERWQEQNPLDHEIDFDTL